VAARVDECRATIGLYRQNSAVKQGFEAFQQATLANNFFSPLKQKRAQKMFNSSNKQLHKAVSSASFSGLRLKEGEI